MVEVFALDFKEKFGSWRMPVYTPAAQVGIGWNGGASVEELKGLGVQELGQNSAGSG
jgi:hypothetical protein